MHWVHTMAQAKEKEKKYLPIKKLACIFVVQKIKRLWLYQHTNIYGTPNTPKKD